MLRAVSSVWHTFQACGFMSWFCLLASLLADGLGVVAVVAALLRARWARPISWLALALALLPAGLGVVAMGLGRAKVDEVLESGVVDPSVVERIREEGYSEASGCVSVGATLSAAPLLLAVMALVLAHTLRARRSDG